MLGCDPRHECHERLARIEEQLAALTKAVLGNGQPGLVQRLSAVEHWRSGIVAVIAFLAAAGGLAIAAWKR